MKQINQKIKEKDGVKIVTADVGSPDTKKIMILIPHTHPTFSTNFTISFMAMMAHTYEWNFSNGCKYQIETMFHSGLGGIDKVREAGATDAITMGCDVIVWCDTDQLYPPTGIVKMLKHLEENDEVEAVGGLITFKAPPYMPHLYGPNSKHKNGFGLAKSFALNRIIPTKGIGFGFCAIRSAVFDRVKKPWFEFKYDKNDKLLEGEDLGFCLKSKMNCIVDPTIVVKHLKEVGYDINDYISYNGLEVKKDGDVVYIDPPKEKSDAIYDKHIGKEKTVTFEKV